MSNSREHEIQAQFLDEAQEYLGTLEGAVLGLAGSRVDLQKVNAAMRAAHSIKGGAAMMGFLVLSDLAHRLEDAFKVLKVQRQSLAIEPELEQRLLRAVDCLQQVIQSDRQGVAISPAWLTTEAYPIFEQLQAELGDPQDEDATSVLSTEGSQDVVGMVFGTEVDSLLDQLEGALAAPNPEGLIEAVTNLAIDLGGLGEMLQLAAFTQLCEAVVETVVRRPGDIVTVAQAALQTWRRSQALVLTQQLDLLPTALEGALEGALEAISPAGAGLGEGIAAVNPDLDHATLYHPELGHPELGHPELGHPGLLPYAWATEWDGNPISATAEGAASDSVASSSASGSSSSSSSSSSSFSEFLRNTSTSNTSISNTSTSTSNNSLPAEEEDSIVRVSLRNINQLNDLFGELTIERNAMELYMERLHSLAQVLKRRVQSLQQTNQELRTAYDRLASGGGLPSVGPGSEEGSVLPNLQPEATLAATNDFDILEFDRYNQLSLMSQTAIERIVQIQEVTTDIDLSLNEADQTLRNLSKTSKQFRKNLNNLRMRPLSDVVDRFPRAVRDMALQYQKAVRLNLVGSNTLIDRSILEGLQEPLMHLVRNAFDHGIEDPETRQLRGKPAEGVIEIRAIQETNQTLIQVRDDGGGIDTNRIRSKAEAMGLDGGLLERASEQDLLSLIFEPGFSTRDQVSTLSGRGVGMDVVRERLKQLRGNISIETQVGTGTTFTIAVPFTLSVLRILLVESNGLLLAFPADAIQEVIMVESLGADFNPGASKPFTWEEKTIQPLLLSQWLQFNCARQPYTLEANPKINAPLMLMVRQGQQWLGIQVDRSWGEQEVAVRRVEGTIPMPTGFSNCTILGDGRVVPLVNWAELLQWIHTCEDSEGTASLFPIAPDALAIAAATKPTLLVVDDSINVRRFLTLTLEKAGYRVEQAKDGQEALDKLQSGLTVKGVICDVEMPRLDGYGFLAKLKADHGLNHLPVAMLTSRSGDKHRQLAMRLGASAYFSKPYNEQEMLQRLEEMLMRKPVSVA